MHHPRETIENIDKFRVSLYPLVEGFRCVEVMIPDDDSYLFILAGLHAQMSKTWSWQGDLEDRKARAQLWQDAYDATDWEGCMSCQDVADCIESDPDVIQAINNVYNPNSPAQPLPDEVADENIINGVTDCDKDELFGALVSLIDGMNENNKDAFEVIEEAGNVLERVAAVLAAIPVFETLPIDDLVGYVQTLWTDDIFEGYLAADTQEYRDELACDLFCIARDANCVLSIRDVYNYFVERIAASPEDNLSDIINYIIGGTWEGTEINDTFYAFQAATMFYGNKFFDTIGIRPFQTYINYGAKNPNPDWAILCDCPEDWEYDAGLAELELWDDYVQADAGAWSPGNGWASVNNAFNGTAIFGIVTSLPFECVSVKVYISAAMTGDQNAVFAGDLALAFAVQEVMGTDLEYTLGVDETIDGLAIGYAPNDVGAGYPDFPGYTYRVIVTGRGYQPPELGG